MQSDGKRKVEYSVTLVPLVIVLTLSFLIVYFSETAGNVINSVRNFLGNDFGVYYLLFGLVFVLVSLFVAFSRYGKIKLGNIEKPRFSTISWAFMIFTSTMAADILFYSLYEWTCYWNLSTLDQGTLSTQQKVLWSETYSLFHWGLTPWTFYILPSVAYAYMIHVKGRGRQKISEACRPLLGNRVDGLVGKIIDIVSVVALLLATSTTFSVATPLLSRALSEVFGVNDSTALTIVILMTIAVIYTLAVVSGFKGISRVSSACVVLFLALVSIFLFNHNFRFIVENAFSSIGNLVHNFLRLSTWTDSTRMSGNGITSVPQDWTVFYWAYWIAWSIATPFFIAKISEGRTVKQLVIGGTLSGVSCTFLSFSVFGGFGIAEQISGTPIVESMSGDISGTIILIFGRLKFPKISLLVLSLAMIGFYASTFDALTHVISSYSYKSLRPDEEPGKLSKIYWSVLFVALPCALLFSESTMYQLQSLSIIAAFPVSILMIVVVVSFFKDARSSRR